MNIETSIYFLLQRGGPTREELCQQQQEQCNVLRCPYGISKTYDENGCERCECENPCRDYVCPEDSKCAVDFSQYDQSFAPVCRKSKFPNKNHKKKTRKH